MKNKKLVKKVEKLQKKLDKKNSQLSKVREENDKLVDVSTSLLELIEDRDFTAYPKIVGTAMRECETSIEIDVDKIIVEETSEKAAGVCVSNLYQLVMAHDYILSELCRKELINPTEKRAFRKKLWFAIDNYIMFWGKEMYMEVSKIEYRGNKFYTIDLYNEKPDEVIYPFSSK